MRKYITIENDDDGVCFQVWDSKHEAESYLANQNDVLIIEVNCPFEIRNLYK